MEKKLLRKVQLVQLEISKEIRRVCEENNIEYWLDSGSLLGAVRHKGFIPWDDDMDIGMKRDQYEKFLKIAPKKLRPQFFLQTWESDINYGFPFAKIRKKGTVYIENRSKKSSAYNGFYVDIFPYDNYGNSVKQGFALKTIKTIMQYKAGVRSWEEDKINIPRLIKNIPTIIIAPLLSRKKLIKLYDYYSRQYNKSKCKYLFPQGIVGYDKWLIPSHAMTTMIDMPFEDTTFKVPAGYDKYLRHAYGNYMELPPVDKRENRHQIIKVKF